MDENATLLPRYAKRPVIVGWLLAAAVLISFRQWQTRQRGFTFVDTTSLSASSSSNPASSPSSFSSPSPSDVTYSTIDYNGWSGCWLVENQQVQAIVVPAISRVMEFRFRDSPSPESSPFWVHNELNGQAADMSAEDWLNFGGDKAWPGPQSQWGATLSDRKWPPPAVFDAGPFQEVSVQEGVLVLTSAVDRWTGLQSVRRLSLSGASMTIKTELIQVAKRSASGGNNNVSVWTVTQLKDPQKLYMLSHPNRLKESFIVLPDLGPLQATGVPASLQQTPVVCSGNKKGSLISLLRDPVSSHKIGSSHSSSMVWVGTEVMLQIESALQPSELYIDHGCHAEIWSNPDPLAYVELEFLGPFGQSAKRDSSGREYGRGNPLTAVYTLHHRRLDAQSIDDEVLRILECKYF